MPSSSSSFEKTCANLFILTVTIFMMLVFSEILMKFFFHPTYNFQTAGMLNGHGEELKVELIPDNLYEIKPNKELGINNEGFRDKDFSIVKHGMKRICFFGDSFTMGLNVRSQETMPKMLEKQLKDFEVYNMGVVGFGPDQELNVLEKYGFKYKPDLVIEAICALNDSGDIYKNQLYDLSSTGEVIKTKTNPVITSVFTSSFALINQINFLKNRTQIVNYLDSLLFGDSYDLAWMKYSDLDESKYKYSLMQAILKKTNEEVKQRNINFLAVIIPSYENICDDKFLKENHVDPDKYFINEELYQHLLETENIPYINLVPYFMKISKNQRCGLYDAGNGHLSSFGNWFSAQIILRYMADHELIKNEFSR